MCGMVPLRKEKLMGVDVNGGRGGRALIGRGAEAVRWAADRLLGHFLPEMERPVQAADCWYEYWCEADGGHGSIRWQRHCCRRPAGGVTCGPWNAICEQCCIP
jgi:hypothetical protein